VRSLDIGTLISSAIDWLGLAASQLVAMTSAALGKPYSIDETGRFSLWSDEREAAARDQVSSARRQRVVTNQLLAAVAKCYLMADRAPTETVAREFNTSKRNATRWVATARERGFLPAYEGFAKGATDDGQ
jgi:hypothetical protein